MKITVVKEFQFDAAHHLPGYIGKCHNVHGHRYRLQVGLTGDIDENTGMVVDFGEIKDRVDFLIEKLDHRDLNTIDEAGFPHHMPTAENMVRWFVEQLQGAFHPVFMQEALELTFIRLWETPGSFAEWKMPDKDLVERFLKEALNYKK